MYSCLKLQLNVPANPPRHGSARNREKFTQKSGDSSQLASHTHQQRKIPLHQPHDGFLPRLPAFTEVGRIFRRTAFAELEIAV